jgi:hypothetical protein
MVDVLGLVLAEDLQSVDLLEELAVRIGSAWVEGIALINIDDLDGDDGCGFHVLAAPSSVPMLSHVTCRAVVAATYPMYTRPKLPFPISSTRP